MTILLDRCNGNPTENDLDTVRYALQHEQADGWGAVLDRLRGSYPAVDYYAGSTHVRFLLDGTSHGKSIYVDTLVRVVDTDPAG